MNLDIPFKQSIVTGLAPVSTNTSKTADYLNMGLVLRAIVSVTLTQAVANATTITLRQARDNTGTGLKDLEKPIPIWSNEDVATSDGMEKQTDGVSHAVESDIANKKIVFQVEGDDLDGANDFTHLTVLVGASGEVTNLVNVDYICESRTPGETLTE